MKLPLRNKTESTLTLFIEPWCDQYELPPGAEAIITLDDGAQHSLDYHPDNWVSLWDEGSSFAVVEIVTADQDKVIDALAFARMWLWRYGGSGRSAAKGLDNVVSKLEKEDGHVAARFAAYRAFRAGFRAKFAEGQSRNATLTKWSGADALAMAYRAGGVAAHLNCLTRLDPNMIDLGEPPYETEVAMRKFAEADTIASE